MFGLPQKKCAYYNSEYCKFSRKETGCKNYHAKEICKVTKCRDKKCQERHSKECRFQEECRFQLGCSYKHTKPEPKQNVSEEVKSLIEDVDTLKKEIVNLKDENDIKINNLVKVQLAELKEIRNENEKLKVNLNLSQESFDVALRSKDVELDNLRRRIKEEKDIVSAQLLEVRKQNQILKNKLSNDNKAAELKLITKEEELKNALTKNIEHEQAIKILKEQLSTNPEYLNVTLASKDAKIIQAHKVIERI